MNTSSLQTVSDWLDFSTSSLKQAEIESARLDSLIILEDCLNLPRVKILAESKQIKLNASDLSKLNKSLERRLDYEPIAYIRQACEFYGRKFFVTKDVLIPRSESESFIDILKSDLVKNGDSVVDIGTGSGCLGITTKLEFPRTKVELVEISSPAIKIAKRNIESLGVKVKLTRGNLLHSNNNNYQIILANLPYVPANFCLDRSTSYEPKIAIFAGQDGLDLYRELFSLITLRAEKPRYVLVEALEAQHDKLANLAKKAQYKPFKTLGLVSCFKFTN